MRKMGLERMPVMEFRDLELLLLQATPKPRHEIYLRLPFKGLRLYTPIMALLFPERDL